MSKQYAPLAADIVRLVGGKANITEAYHCQTRLRFALKDESAVALDELNATEGIVKTLSKGGVFQVVVGMHVKDVFDEMEHELGDLSANANDADGAAKDKHKKVGSAVIEFVSSVFQPLIPALSGAGMVKALLALLVVLKVVNTGSQTYVLVNLFADAVFYFLPVLLAFSAAQKLKISPILAAAVAAMMLHPNWVALVTKKDPVTFFDILPFPLVNYSGAVIPIILVVFAQFYVERGLTRVIPKSVNLVFVPMLTFLVMGTLALGVLGPIGSILSGYLGSFFTFLSTNAAWAPALLVGATLPVMVMFGLHNGIAPLGVVQLAQTGKESIFGPGALVSNIAMGAAALVVAFRTKDKKTRQIATAGGITGLMGITEPILYGVALPKRYPLIAAMIGGGAGGLYAGLSQAHRFATGSSGLPAVLLYIGDNSLVNMINIIIALVISAAVSAVLTFALSLKFEKAAVDAAPAADDVVAAPSRRRTAAAESAFTAGGTATLVRTETVELAAPCAGTVVPLAEVSDPVFASGAMGQGIAVEPSESVIVSPVSGTVAVAMKTGHAFGIKTDDGVEVLVHVGIDTVTMKGEGFHGALERGTRVEAGQPLVTADLDAIRAAGHPATVLVVVTNGPTDAPVEQLEGGSVVAGAAIAAVGR
ncbi:MULTISPECIES: beta-glucoside-specific PTS transporter subunit IIABC [Arthrobacter]|uniref:PTS beta-glucoside transporter subunit EIIBCA n=1 Tax=Arthrobacter terricola TaxID=2547396 RepID=A0A4R5KG93_9MICC|nr:MULTISPECIES: beta-glucoside-specific PTS transporter subunit IIABC [Arthrobacter]MBT8162412.1 beta-glucoside-specific PTS transporter subunit IIABC [Arthrobacter sp. GN70]TDF93337.1 PTS beta-glucoside transporter subunit EIIBCA [Arthrobacter terricola]